MSFGKLQEVRPTRPITYRFQNVFNLTLFAVAIGLFGWLIYDATNATVLYTMLALGAVLGVLMVLPIGGAAVPGALALPKSYAGLAAAGAGFALNNHVVIIAGALDGPSGFLLSMLMSKAMNRSFANVLFGAFGAAPAGGPTATSVAGLTVRSMSAEDAAVKTTFPGSRAVGPGYGSGGARAPREGGGVAERVTSKRGT